MTDAEKIRLLREMQIHTTTRTPEQQAEVDREVAEIDTSIEDYTEQIAALEEKLANMDNYQYVNPNLEEREFFEELFQDSLTEQLETLDREDQEYQELQEMGATFLREYDIEIAELNDAIVSIERRLRKNEVAVSRNMRMQLTAEEVEDLNRELEAKRNRIIRCEELKAEYASELTDYSDLVAANSKKREIVTAKQNKFTTLKENRINNENTIDKHNLRLDQDELARLKAGLAALQSRKENITYDINDKIASLIADLEKTSQKEDNIELAPIGIINDLEDDEKQEENSDIILGVPVARDIYSDDIEAPDYEAALLAPSDLDEERKAEIEETKAELLEKKKTSKVKEFLKRHKVKFIAAGLTIAILLGIKGCSSLKDSNKNDIKNTSSYTQEIDEEEEKDVEQDQTQEENTQGNTTPDPGPEPTPDLDSIPETEPEPTPDLEPIPEPEPEPEPTPNLEPIPEPEPEPEPTPDLEPIPEPEVEKEIELSAGESVANASDIFGNDGADTVDNDQDMNNNFEDQKIEHGDEIGTRLDSGVEVKDYTEEGNAVVELPTETPTEVVEDTNGKTFHETLEDFFGGPISITESENSYELGEENTSSKTR